MRQLEKVFHIQNTSTCTGVVYNGKYYAVACDVVNKDRSIKILDNRGKQIHVIKCTQAYGIQLKLTEYIELDKEMDVIYTADGRFQNQRVLCLTFTGVPLWQANLPGPARGIHLLNSKIMLVAVYMDDRIHELDINGNDFGCLLTKTDGLNGPYQINWQKNTRKLLITNHSKTLVTVVNCE